MPSTYLTRIQATGGAAALEMARLWLFIDAAHFRRCVGRAHERFTGSPVTPNLVNIDGAGISNWVQRAALELGLVAPDEAGRARASRCIYDVLYEDRRERWGQRRYHGVLEAEGCVVKAARAARGDRTTVEACLAADLVRLTKSGQIDAALLLVGDDDYAGTVVDARQHGAEVVLLVPPASGALVAESLAVAATRAMALHPEVFETLYHLRS